MLCGQNILHTLEWQFGYLGLTQKCEPSEGAKNISRNEREGITGLQEGIINMRTTIVPRTILHRTLNGIELIET